MEREELRRKFISAKRALFDKYYASLNERQREAVYAVNGPLLVLAGRITRSAIHLKNQIQFSAARYILPISLKKFPSLQSGKRPNERHG